MTIMKPISIIYVINNYSKNDQSHLGHVFNFLEKLISNGCRVVLVIERGSDDTLKNIYNFEIIFQKQTNKLLRALELFAILKKLKSTGYEYVFIRISILAALVAVLSSRITGLKVYYWLSGILPSYNTLNKKVQFYISTYLPLSIIKTFCYRFVTGPESMINYMESYLRIHKSKLCLLYNDINLNRFKSLSSKERKELKSSFGYSDDEFICLYVKRLSPIKGVKLYFPAIFDDVFSDNTITNFKFIIIGDGIEKNYLIDSIKDKWYKNNIIIMGGLPNDIIQQYYQISDLFLNCTAEEGFPRVLIEAMGSRLPVVSTNVGGIKDILVGEQRKYLFDYDDIIGLSKSIKTLFFDKNLCNKLAAENINRVELYSTERVVDMFIKTLN
jgi:glycosyltransferase involved in cell wall biosynthesis